MSDFSGNDMMSGYPIMLNLQGKSVVVVGGGKVASRKVSHLLNAGANVTVICPMMTQSLQELVEQEKIGWLAQAYDVELLRKAKPSLVFAATDSNTLNQQIAQDSRVMGVWANLVSDSQQSDFHNMAVIEEAPLTIGISTNGNSPALLKLIKAKIEAAIGNSIPVLAAWLGEIRANIKSDIATQSDRQALYEQIIESDVLDLLQSGDVDAARDRFDALINNEVIA